jgi:hypothetical protein
VKIEGRAGEFVVRIQTNSEIQVQQLNLFHIEAFEFCKVVHEDVAVYLVEVLTGIKLAVDYRHERLESTI